MSTIQSRFVSPGAAYATVMDPLLFSTHPTAREKPEALSAAAWVEVMPLVPNHDPVLRPLVMAASVSAAERPAATVIRPLPTSVSPPAFGSRPPTVVLSVPESVSVPPTSGTIRLEESAVL